jgi:hypothetical protein
VKFDVIRILRFEIIREIRSHSRYSLNISTKKANLSAGLLTGKCPAGPPCGRVKGHNKNEISFPGSAGLWPESFIFFRNPVRGELTLPRILPP